MNTTSCAVVIATVLIVASSARAGVIAGSESASASGVGGGSESVNFGEVTINGVTATVEAPRLVTDNNTGMGAGAAYGDVYGNFSVVAHACVEPPQMGGFTSAAGGSGSIGYTDTFRIQSATVADGTPVAIDFCVISLLAKQNSNAIADSSQTQVQSTAHAFFSAGNTSLTGDYSFAQNRLTTTSTTGGVFNSLQPTGFTANGVVGQNFTVSFQLNSQTTAFVDPGDMGDVQVQSIFVWGGVSETAGVDLVSLNTGLNMPDMTNCNYSYVQANIPPPLINLSGPGLPEPGSLTLFALGGFALLACRRRRP